MDQESALDKHPKLHELDLIRGNQKVVKVLEGAASKWDGIARRLHFDGNMISQVRTESQSDQLRACQSLFTQWLNGKEGLRTPVTWRTVIEVLEEADLTILAGDLKTVLLSGTSEKATTSEANPRTPFSSTMSTEKFQDFLKEQGVMDADRIKMSDNGIGALAFAELTEKNIDDLGFTFGGKITLKKVLAQVKAHQGPSGQQNGSTAPPTAAPDTQGLGPHLTISDLNLVNEEVRDTRAKWYHLGLELHLDPNDLDSIESSCRGNPSDCLLDTLKLFLKRAQPKPTWKMIVDAVGSRSVGHGLLADRIKTKYIK